MKIRGAFFCGTLALAALGSPITLLKSGFYNPLPAIDGTEEFLHAVSTGPVYAVGYHLASAGHQRALITKFTNDNLDTSSNLIEPFSDGYFTKIRTSGSNFIVGGSIINDPYVAKVDSSLSKVWSYAYAETDDEIAGVRDLKVDSAGNVYIAAVIGNSATASDFLTIKLDPNGNKLWAARYASASTGPVGIQLSDAGDVFVAGPSTVAGKLSKQIVLLKYDTNGNLIDSVTKGTNYAGHDAKVSGMACNGYQVAVAGTIYNGPTNKNDAVMVGWSVYSLTESIYRTEDRAQLDDDGVDIDYDGSSNAVMVCRMSNPSGVDSMRLISVKASTGFKNWTYEDFSVADARTPVCVNADLYGRCYVGGSLTVSGLTLARVLAVENGVGKWDLATAKGQINWVDTGYIYSGKIAAVGRAKDPNGTAGDIDPYMDLFIEDPVLIPDSYVMKANETLTPPSFFEGVYNNDRYRGAGYGSYALSGGPDHGGLDLRANGTFDYVPDANFSGIDTFKYAWIWNSKFVETTVTIDVRHTVKDLTSADASLDGLDSTTMNVVLTNPAPTGGSSVALSSNNASLTVPANVVVPETATNANFVVNSVPVATSTNVVVTATLNGFSKSKTLALVPLKPVLISINPSPAWGGSTPTGRVQLSGRAGVGGQAVQLTDNSSFVTVPASVTVTNTSLTAQFPITTTNPGSTQTVTLTARIGAITVSKNFILNRVCAQSLSLSPNILTGGGSSTATFTTNGPVPPGGATVFVVDNSVKVNTPPSFMMPAGSTQQTFNVTTAPVTATVSCTIRATYNGASGTAVLTVNP